jgi:hypothetical protein
MPIYMGGVADKKIEQQPALAAPAPFPSWRMNRETSGG